MSTEKYIYTYIHICTILCTSMYRKGKYDDRTYRKKEDNKRVIPHLKINPRKRETIKLSYASERCTKLFCKCACMRTHWCKILKSSMNNEYRLLRRINKTWNAYIKGETWRKQFLFCEGCCSHFVFSKFFLPWKILIYSSSSLYTNRKLSIHLGLDFRAL